MGAVEDLVLVVARSVGVDDFRIVDLGDFVGLAIDRVELDRVAGLEVGSEVDGVCAVDVEPCFVCEFVVTFFNLGELGKASEYIVLEIQSIVVDDKRRSFGDGPRVGRVFDGSP